MSRKLSVCALALCAGALPGVASAQSAEPMAFVANNGNLIGAVSSMRFTPDGEPVFVDKVITGQREPGDPTEPGTNAYSISLSPNGRWLATTHTTASTTVEQVTVMRVGRDGSLEIAGTFQTPNSPLDLTWINNELLAVTRTQFGGDNRVYVYRWDERTLQAEEVDNQPTGGFNSSLHLHPSRRILYANDSLVNAIRVFSIDASGQLTLIQEEGTGDVFPLMPQTTNDGTRLYAAGGISSGNQAVLAFDVDPDGFLTPLPGTPFQSTGPSPNRIRFSGDDDYAFIGHGNDATVRSFRIDPTTGNLEATGFIFDVGVQGSIGDIRRLGDWLLVTDNTTISGNLGGLYSFTIEPDGFLTQNGSIGDTGEGQASRIAVWAMECPADLTGSATFGDFDYGVPDGQVDINDFFYFLAKFEQGDPIADINGDGEIDITDFFEYLDLFAQGC